MNKLSRRQAFFWLGNSSLTAAFFISLNNIVKAGAKTPTIVQAWIDAQRSSDASALAELYTEDGILEDVPNEFKVQGQSSIECFAQAVEQKFSNVNIEILDAFSGANKATVEYFFSATNNGLIPVPSTIGKSFKVRTTTIFDLKGNKIQRSSDYYDRTAILVQLGLTPPPPPTAPIGCE